MHFFLRSEFLKLPAGIPVFKVFFKKNENRIYKKRGKEAIAIPRASVCPRCCIMGTEANERTPNPTIVVSPEPMTAMPIACTVVFMESSWLMFLSLSSLYLASTNTPYSTPSPSIMEERPLLLRKVVSRAIRVFHRPDQTKGEWCKNKECMSICPFHYKQQKQNYDC